jgi:hypothetical protein
LVLRGRGTISSNNVVLVLVGFIVISSCGLMRV